MIARKTSFLLLVVALVVLGAALGEAATYNVNLGNWGWYNPWKQSTPTVPEEDPNPPAPAPSPEPPTTNPQPVEGLTAEENLSLAKLNAERTKRGLAPLKANMTLVRLARLKSQDMAENSYFDHVSPTFGTAKDMMDEAGLNYKFWGENIARVSSVTVAHEAFMESPGHRTNILSAGYNEVGIGVFRKGTRVYVTQMFMKSRIPSDSVPVPAPVTPPSTPDPSDEQEQEAPVKTPTPSEPSTSRTYLWRFGSWSTW